ncbi:hypothetical protein halTADL_3179 [Halohasta litchfieldiae]|jgi:hypothetical protein|uniref:Uncharacterized protein n=1 Tax=Halohasta litchfieldiae TaxID=1073996 RepID=A0A1H6SRK3_9EURY|nr:hypothetical protein [Halohasta litchfieldiae]ATW89881.1 hypothetical protein halTADL_3179 [Halohasta litchfieldiae]SEI67397.1 hypothetical protein SAMN05444271_105108 [Halohasta litchfieldiae]
MSTHIKRLCDSLELPRADAWAAHATVEGWLRAESAPDSDTSIDRLRVGSRLLSRLETDGRLTRDQLSLLADLCQQRLDDDTAPARDRESLAAVVDHVEYTLDMCST